MRPSVLGVGALSALILAGSVQAKDIYVSIETGSKKGDGTKESPRKFLWRVMKDMAQGDRVLVAEGVYHGQKKSGTMPRIEVPYVTIQGGWKSDFSERDPFKYPSVITGEADTQADTAEVFYYAPANPASIAGGTQVTLDGFVIDRGPALYYNGRGEGGTNIQEGYVDTSCWGYQGINKKKSGSDPAIELLGKGGFVVRNMVMVNNPWWGISIKAGGGETVLIENNFVLGYQGRGIEAIAGGGWGEPTFIIRNNTVAFGDAMEGRALSLDPRKGYSGKYVVEKNVLAYGAQTGVMTKFGAATLSLNDNLIIGFTQGDYGDGGSGCCNVEDFEDELEFDAEDNVHETPEFLTKLAKPWVDRWSQWKSMTSDRFTDEEVMAARAKAGLGAYELPFFPGKTYSTYKELPSGRIGMHMSRYPHPYKKGEALMDVKADVLGVIGADGARGIGPFSEAAAPAAGGKDDL